MGCRHVPPQCHRLQDAGAAPKLTLKVSVDYGTPENEENKEEGKTLLLPLLKSLLIVLATAVIVAALVILAVSAVPLDNTIPHELRSNLTDQERVMAILSRGPLIAGHNDFFYVLNILIGNKLDTVDFSRDVTEQWGFSQTDIPRMRQGMLGAQFWAVFAPCSTQEADAVRVSMEQVDIVKRFVAQYSDTFTLVTTYKGILETFENGRIASLISLKGGHSIGSSLATMRMFYDLGVRSLTLTHDCNTPWADSLKFTSDDLIPDHGGLTEFGKLVVKEMNRLGMIIDLSHATYDTVVDTLNVTTAPVIFSQTAAWELCNHIFNLNDDILQMVQENNGIVMVYFLMAGIDCPPNQVSTPAVSSVADHIEYIYRVAGPNHVGIGATFDEEVFYNLNGTSGGNMNPLDGQGLEDVAHYPDLFIELVSRGWTDEDLEKLAGRNFLRVFSAVEEERDRLSSMIGPIEDLIPEADVSDLPGYIQPI